MNYNEIDLTFNPFQKIGSEWALLGATAKGESNAMTVSWGEVGVLWNKPIFTVFVRPTRHTYSLLEKSDFATLSFFDEDMRKTLSYFGRTSGRDENKLEASGISYKAEDDFLTFPEARLTLTGRLIYFDDVNPENFRDDEIQSHYNNDYHRVYVYEIIKVSER